MRTHRIGSPTMAANISDDGLHGDYPEYDFEDGDDLHDDEGVVARDDGEPSAAAAPVRGRRRARASADVEDLDLEATDVDVPMAPAVATRAGRRTPVWRLIDEYREEKRLRALLREVYDDDD